jgi:hypothetical protein
MAERRELYEKTSACPSDGFDLPCIAYFHRRRTGRLSSAGGDEGSFA